jgi:hypothetical protein
VVSVTDDVLLVTTQEVRSNSGTKNITREPREFIPGIPVTGDLDCVFLIEDRVEKRLPRKARWKFAKTIGADEF